MKVEFRDIREVDLQEESKTLDEEFTLDLFLYPKKRAWPEFDELSDPDEEFSENEELVIEEIGDSKGQGLISFLISFLFRTYKIYCACTFHGIPCNRTDLGI